MKGRGPLLTAFPQLSLRTPHVSLLLDSNPFDYPEVRLTPLPTPTSNVIYNQSVVLPADTRGD